MARNRIRKFPDIDQLEIFLNGGLIGGSVSMAPGPPSNNAPGIIGLVGKTLILSGSGPSGTVTFAASSGSNPNPQVLLFSDIASQITTVMGTLTVRSYLGRLVLIETTPLHGLTVSHTGTANSLLGFDNANDTISFFYPFVAQSGAPPAAPYWSWLYTTNDNAHVVATYE